MRARGPAELHIDFRPGCSEADYLVTTLTVSKISCASTKVLGGNFERMNRAG